MRSGSGSGCASDCDGLEWPISIPSSALAEKRWLLHDDQPDLLNEGRLAAAAVADLAPA